MADVTMTDLRARLVIERDAERRSAVREDFTNHQRDLAAARGWAFALVVDLIDGVTPFIARDVTGVERPVRRVAVRAAGPNNVFTLNDGERIVSANWARDRGEQGLLYVFIARDVDEENHDG